MPAPGKWVIAHRGYHGRGVPENTLAAFERAIRLGAYGIEFDVRRLADATLVVYHNASIAGCALGSLAQGELHELAITAGVLVPTLRQVLELCRGRIRLDIELKESGCEEEVLRSLFNLRWRVDDYLLTSFLSPVLEAVHFAQAGARTGLLTEHSDFDRALAEIQSVGAGYLLPWVANLTGASLARAGALGVPLVPWTVNHRDQMHTLLSHPSVAGIITDRPHTALSLAHS